MAFGRFVQGCSSRSEAHAAGQDLTTLLGLKYMHVCIRCAPSCEVRFAPGPMWHACDRPEAAASTGSGSRASPASRLCSSSTCGDQTSGLKVGRGPDASIRQEVGSYYLRVKRRNPPLNLAPARYSGQGGVLDGPKAPPPITDRTQGHLPGFEMPVFQFLRLKQTKTRFLCKTKKPRYSVESM